MPVLHSSPVAKLPRRPALISKHGRLRILEKRIKRTHFRANLRDAFNYLLSHNTWWLLIFFATSYVLCFLLFGCFWYLIHRNDSSCLAEVNSFNEAFLFSIETQSTIGYGSKHVQGSCHWGIFLLLLQNITGSLLDAMLMGLIFTRMTRPDRRTYTLRCRYVQRHCARSWGLSYYVVVSLFSSRAVICNRDGQRCLLLRVADMRQKESPLLACIAKLYLTYEHVTTEGEVIPYHTKSLELLNVCGKHCALPQTELGGCR